MVALLQITAKYLYNLRHLYYKLRQYVITNYYSFIKLLQITAAFGVIINYGNTLLQITADITNYDVITNYVLLEGSLLESFIKEHCSANKELNISVFSLKLVTYLCC